MEESKRTCFIIMPIAEFEPYSNGHFKRVYDHIIKPACKLAGFEPIRADEVFNTNYIALDIIKRIINADLALCDLSGRNPNVFYELGVRQAFNLPVTLIKDSSTSRVFDIQGFRDIEYDVNLRIDSVQQTVTLLAETLKNTYESQGKEINSLIALLGIEPAKVAASVEITADTQLILNSINSIGIRLRELETRRRQPEIISKPVFAIEVAEYPKPGNYDLSKIIPGAVVQHEKFGVGYVVSREGSVKNPIATIQFKSGDLLKLMLSYTALIILKESPEISVSENVQDL